MIIIIIIIIARHGKPRQGQGRLKATAAVIATKKEEQDDQEAEEEEEKRGVRRWHTRDVEDEIRPCVW